VKKFWIVFVVLVLLVGGGLGFLWWTVASLQGEAAHVPGGVLVWRAQGSLPEETDTSFVGQLRTGLRPTLTDVVLGLRRAAVDPRITALVLDLRGLQVSWAQLEELRTAVVRFREGGKPVWACLEWAGNADFALATAADRVAISPEGNVMAMGVAAELAFLADTLDKVGLEADYVHVGRYKSAPEQLTRSAPSDANREMTESLVAERYDILTGLVSTGRGVEPAVARQWIDRGLWDAPTALAAGLVDTILYREDLLEEVLGGEDTTDLGDYVRDRARGRRGPEVALVYAVGTIMPGESDDSAWQGKILGSDTLVDQLAQVAEDDDVAAVILRVDSPGGSALASDLIWREIERVRARKPVLVSMGTYAASGGYYLSCGADSIFADPGTLTGSIGVFAGKMVWSGLFDKIELNRTFISRGENALMFSDAAPFTDDQRAMFQGSLDRFYERFVAKVAAGRGLTPAAVEAVAQGRVWSGRQAREVGLVDDLGGLERAVLAAKLRLGLAPDDPIRLRIFEEELSWLERVLLNSLSARGIASVDPVAEVGPAMALAQRELQRTGLGSVLPLLDGQPLALLPLRVVFH